MKSKKKIKKWLLNNCIDKNGDLDLTGLDFSDFENNINTSGMKVKKSLIQKGHVVGIDLFQSGQEVKGFLYQDSQKVKCDLYQDSQKVKGGLYQSHQKVAGDLYQNNQEVEGKLIQVIIVAPPTVNHDFKDPEHWDPTPKDINNHHNCIDIIVEENHDLKVKVRELEISLRAYRDWVKELKDKIKEEMNNE